jgi:hypothetical protein
MFDRTISTDLAQSRQNSLQKAILPSFFLFCLYQRQDYFHVARDRSSDSNRPAENNWLSI